MTRRTASMLPLVFLSSLTFIGCGSESSPEEEARFDPPVLRAEDDGQPVERTIADVFRELGVDDRAEARKSGGKIRLMNLAEQRISSIAALRGLELTQLDLRATKVADLSPLAGMPLEELYLEQTPLTDLSPLAGMPLKKLYLNETPVSDISPLEGMPLKELNLNDTQVESIAAVRGMPLGILWIPNTKVTDLSPLQGSRLVSLDVENTPVTSLEPLRELSTLQRLNIAGAEVTDLTPIGGLGLTRLIFTPGRIQAGIDTVRQMPSLENIGPTFDGVMPPAEFWPKYDAGEF